jgi:hypothetical protein
MYPYLTGSVAKRWADNQRWPTPRSPTAKTQKTLMHCQGNSKLNSNDPADALID